MRRAACAGDTESQRFLVEARALIRREDTQGGAFRPWSVCRAGNPDNSGDRTRRAVLKAVSSSRNPTMNTNPLSLPILCTLLSLGHAAGLAAQQRPHFLAPTQMPAPVNLAGSSSYSMALSADGLQAMVETDRPGGRGGRDLILLRRLNTQSSFTSYGPMGFCEDHDEGGGFYEWDWDKCFHSNRPGGAGGHDLYIVAGNLAPQPMTRLNSAWDDTHPAITGDGLELFFTSNRPGSLGGRSIWRSGRASINDAWGFPVCLPGIDSANHEQSPSLSDDGLWLFFASDRSGNFDIYAAGRSSRQSAFGAPARVPELSGPNHEIGFAGWNLGSSGQDGIALITVMIDGRAVILSAMRDGNAPMLLASNRVAPGEILSAQLRAPVGQLGIVLLGAPMAPVNLPIGELQLDPRVGVLVLDAGIQADATRLVQMLLPAGEHLHGLPIALQALVGISPNLRLSNAVRLVVE